ncbi:MAG TPA: extracellular solute-binding protein [Acidimicrobiales bacterium]|nr:extracellular solute-binding protein [Acidimicrobiales bacterium]
MGGTIRARRRIRRALVAALALGLLGATGAPPAGASHPRASGPVDVLYAGSLFDVMTQSIGPAFTRATGYTLSGVANGSTALASEIKGGTQVADVFISASPTVNASLAGAANGDWLSSYTVFGASTLVLGYDPHSRFARALRTEPWYDVVGRPGFRLGRTDPATDPKGVLAVDALRGVALSYDRPRLDALATSSADVFPETALVGELQAGQLDAGFFYALEARAAHLATVPLVGTGLAGEFTVAVLNRAPHPSAARAFVRFLLSARGRRLLRRNGVTPIVPARVVRGVGRSPVS